MRFFMMRFRRWGLVPLAVVLSAGCAQSIRHRNIVADLPTPRLVRYDGPMTTMDPFTLAIPNRPACPSRAQSSQLSVSNNATVDPFCFVPPKTQCAPASRATLRDENGIIDPFCSFAGNGG